MPTPSLTRPRLSLLLVLVLSMVMTCAPPVPEEAVVLNLSGLTAEQLAPIEFAIRDARQAPAAGGLQGCFQECTLEFEDDRKLEKCKEACRCIHAETLGKIFSCLKDRIDEIREQVG